MREAGKGQSLQVSGLMEGMEYLGLQVDFTSDDEVKIGISYGDAGLPPAVDRRQATTPRGWTRPRREAGGGRRLEVTRVESLPL